MLQPSGLEIAQMRDPSDSPLSDVQTRFNMYPHLTSKQLSRMVPLLMDSCNMFCHVTVVICFVMLQL